VFFDAGKADLVPVPVFSTLAAAGMGLRAQWQWDRHQFSAEGLVGRQLCRPAAIGPKSTLAPATIRWSF
jgi:hemolysin activation/secretion protein